MENNNAMNRQKKRVVFTTWGSLGDLHPFMGLALEMQSRGHAVAVATLPSYEERVVNAGIEFFPLRPDTPSIETEAAKELIRKIMDVRDGPRYVMKEVLSPYIQDTYADTLTAVNANGGTDLLVSHAIPMASPLVAAKTKTKWISAVLSPVSLPSLYDPPTPPEFPALRKLLLLHPLVAQAFMKLIKSVSESWITPVRELRVRLRLPPGEHPLFEGQHSSRHVLALFSKVLAEVKPDHPVNTTITGFPFFDRDTMKEPPRELMDFLNSGEAPILFTLGSAAVRVGEDFYRTSIEVARQLKRRALLLVSDSGNLAANDWANGIGVFDYAPHSLVMPRSSVVVHQAGIGTTGQALRSGRPMLIVPHGQDQPDNARRCAELGVGKVVSSKKYNVRTAVENLRELLTRDEYTTRAQSVAQEIKREDGIGTACNILETALAH